VTWKNRYIGDPLPTGVLNLLYCAGVDDAHCGLGRNDALMLGARGCADPAWSSRARWSSRRHCYARISFSTVTLSPEPAIVRYLLMLSSTGLFVAPAALAMLISLFVLLASGEVRIYGSTR
jgi:hypothetical protein